MKPKYRNRICTKCNGQWNVSSIGKSDKRYICPICEHKTGAEAVTRRRIRAEKATV